ncbi:AAA family ATPase [Eubacteriaceae bacterium ES3]|nr:AAA family ATPase [Eubacteriaceae bacterium ES3]
MTEQFENIPKDLTALPQWVLRKGKMPINPHNGYGAKAGDPSTWGTLNQCGSALMQQDCKYDGLGFEFNDNGIVGVDLDHVLNDLGIPTTEALDIIKRLDSYTEISPSGTGLHIFVYGDIPQNRKSPEKGIELYKNKRYFTMTGNVFGELKPIQHREEGIMALYDELFQQSPAAVESVQTSIPLTNRTPQEIHSIIQRSNQSEKFYNYYHGQNISNDESSNDMGFCNLLAFWTGKDAALMDAIFRESALMRDKWDRKESTWGTYGNRTIQKAIAECSNVYDPAGYNVAVTEFGTEVVTVKGQQTLPKPKVINMVSMADAEEKEPDWLIKGYMPKYQITTMAGDGGSGKTTVWCALAAAVSSGKKPFLLAGDPLLPLFTGEPQTVAFFSAEDSFEHTLKRRLRKNGANLDNIFSIDIADDNFKDIKFNSPFLQAVIEKYRPALVIFDPIQAFIPPELRMAERNAMRSCLAPLVGYGEKYGTTFLIIVHSNKQGSVWGRKRIADSADIWDISRSVIMAGETQEKPVRYLSHEKSNYSMTSNTVLYTIDDEVVTFQSYTEKKDRDFITAETQTRAAPDRDSAKDFILDYLEDGEKEVKELDSMAGAMSISKKTMERAKADLKKLGLIKYRTESLGDKKGTKHFLSLAGLALMPTK